MSNSIISSIALIPARSGSKRVKDKNIRSLNGHPMIAYAISSAIDSGIFDKVVCVTDDQKYADIARYYGAEVPKLRPKGISGDMSSDIEWVLWILEIFNNLNYDSISILRPTSPFRSSKTIVRAWKKFIKKGRSIDSLRAVEKCKQHPGKMWFLENDIMTPVMPFFIEKTPWHSNQYAALPEIYVQNASLEFAWTDMVISKESISGDTIVPFLTKDYEGYDINSELDWLVAEMYIKENPNLLPIINLSSFK
jgi:CMP-N,N'-diacetyllegionaminic acid synthase